MHITLKHLDGFRVAGLQHKGPFHTIGETWQKFGPGVGDAGLWKAGGRIVSLYVIPADKDTPPEELISYAAIEIDAEVNPPEPWVVTEVAAGDYASAVFTGPYEELGKAWDEFSANAEKATGRTYTTSGACMDVYLNDPGTTPANELQTELLTPVQPAT